MRWLIITQSEADLTSHAGLGLIGMAPNERTDLGVDGEAVSPLRSDAMPHANLLSSYIALLCLGKSDFEAINAFREDVFFATALGVEQVPSEGMLRQWMDANATGYQAIVERAVIAFLRRSGAHFTPLDNGLMPLDCDVTPFDNFQSKKEGVSRTDKGMDGYAPMAAYLGQEGYCLELERREGSQHCQQGTPQFLQRIIGRARQLTAAPLLLRLDGGNDLARMPRHVTRPNADASAPLGRSRRWSSRSENYPPGDMSVPCPSRATTVRRSTSRIA